MTPPAKGSVALIGWRHDVEREMLYGSRPGPVAVASRASHTFSLDVTVIGDANAAAFEMMLRAWLGGMNAPAPREVDGDAPLLTVVAPMLEAAK